jgi:hypothetical protein
MKETRERTKRRAECCEHSAPPKHPRLTGSEAEGKRNYDTQGQIAVEGKSKELSGRLPFTGLPLITLGNGQLRDVTREVIKAIRAAGKEEPLLYVRGERLTRIVVDSDGHPQVNFVGVEAMPEIMSRAADFIRIRNNRDSSIVGVFPPESLAKAVVSRGRWPFPRLRGIVEIPTLRKDGSILNKPGYDPISELYYHPDGLYPKIPESPTQKDAESAADFLLDVLSDFPFQDDASRDNALGLLMTVVVKEIVGLVPLALIDAPTRGTGKTRLAQLASIVSTGRELPLSPEVRDDEEWRKKITSLLIADRPVIIIDNVERTLCSGQLSTILTTSEWTDRILGKSEVLHLHSRAVWIATGNNIRLGGDIPRRAWWIRLNANLPRPWMRDIGEFKRELPAWAIEHRAEIVAALLTMARAWFLDGKPNWSGRPPGSYETWGRTVGGILEYCGVNHFLSNLESLYDRTDEDFTEWSAFFSAVFDVFGEGSAFSTKILTEQITSEGNPLKSALPESLGDPGDKNFPRRLGVAIKKRNDQIFEMGKSLIQLREEAPDRHRHKTQWKLVCTRSAPIAPIATVSDGHCRIEKSGSGNETSVSFRHSKGETGAMVATGAGEKPFAFKDDPEERAAIQNEGAKCQDQN